MVLSDNIFSILSGIGVLAAGLGFAYSQFKSGANKAKDDLITTLKETAIAERTKALALAEEKITLVKSHQDQINQLNKELGRLQGMQQSSEKKLEEYLAILQNRNPELEQFIVTLTKTAQEAEIFMANNTKTTEEILKFMKLIEARSTITQAGVDEIKQHAT